ncbi:MAG: HYR domain-containing protein, partial [Acidobacteria bacterium]|nr:HYR domain-containing protein [Acidobacteriota bacterium]
NITNVRWVGLALLCAAGCACAVWQRVAVRAALGLVAQQPPAISTRTLTSTIAGGGFSAIAPPKEAPLVSPAMTARDPLGRGFYVVDEIGGTSMLKFINTSNAAVTLAGVTIPANYIGLIAGGGVAPESGTAREVDLSLVTGIAIDPAGNAAYVAAPLVNAVRAINLSTQPLQMMGQTIAPASIGNLFQISRPELRALAVHPVTRDFYYVSTLANSSTVKVIYRRGNASGQESVWAGGGEPAVGNGDEGLATNARVINPIALAFDKDRRLLIAEGGDARRNPGAIRRVDESGTITSLAKNLEFPTGLSLAPNGDVYVALGNKQQIARVSSNGALTAVAGNNNATACNTEGTSTCGDGGAALLALLTLPASTDNRTFDFAVDANGVVIPGLATRRVRYASFSNSTVTIAGTTLEAKQINSIAGNGQEAPYDHIPATSSELQLPTGVATDQNGNLFITDTAPDPVSRLRFVNRGTTTVTLFPNTVWAKTVQPGHIVTLNDQVGEARSDDRITTASLQWPQGIFATTKGVFIIDSQYGALIKPQGSLSGKRSGHLRFLNTTENDVVLFPASGSFKITVPPGQIKDVAGVNEVAPNSGYGLNGKIGDGGPAAGAVLFPSDVIVSPGGNIFIADQGSNRIRVIDSFTGIIRSVEVAAADGGSVPLTTNGATGMALDTQGRLVIADTKQNQILRQTAPSSLSFVTIANASQGINRPRDVVTDSANNIYVSNSGTSQVMRVVAPTNALGTVTTVAGTALRGFGGDGGTGLRAKFDLPNPAAFDVQLTSSLAFTLTGDLLVTDGNNNRVRMLTPVPNQPPVITAPPDTTLNENDTTTLNFSVTDGNNDPLSLTINNRPSFVTFTDTGNGTGRLTVAPTFSDAGIYTLTISANDGDATETKNFKITVNDVNRPPAVSAQAIAATLEANSTAGRQITLVGGGSDPDNDALLFKWFDGATQIAQVASPAVTLSFGSHSLTLMVTDSKGLSASTTAQTTLVQDTTAPVFANVPADISITASVPTPVNFTLPTANDAVDGMVAVTAQPAPGSTFPVGTTTVNFSAKDARNNT